MSRLAQYQLRIPLDLRSAVAHLAKANKRTMNAEIIEAVERHLATSSAEKDLSSITTRLEAAVKALESKL